MSSRLARALGVVALMLAAVGSAQPLTKPVIVVYTGEDEAFAAMLASLIEADGRMESEVEVAASREAVILASALPQTQCIVVYADNERELEGLEPRLLSFFERGGGLVGMKEACYVPSAGSLATMAFPTYANASVKESNPNSEKARREYVKYDDAEISSGLPDRFPLPSMGQYFLGDVAGNYLGMAGTGSVPFRDQQTGSPLVLTQQNSNGGRSVAFPGIWVLSLSRVKTYYGNLVNDENFVKMFTNSVLWASEGARTQARIGEDLSSLDELRRREEEFPAEMELASSRRRANRSMVLVGLWAIGLTTCGLVVKKLILPSRGHPA